MKFAFSAAHSATLAPLFSRRSAFTLAVLLVMTGWASAHEIKAGGLEIHHPWSRETPEAAQVASGYVEIHNKGASADRLLSASAEIAGKAEIHTMSVDANGVMTMRLLAGGVEIPAGSTIKLKPGGDHIMFMQLKSHPMADTYFEGELVFEKAGRVPVEFAVEKAASGDSHDPAHSQ